MDDGERLSLRMADSVLYRFRPGMMRWHYEQGLVVASCMEVGRFFDEPRFFDWAYAMYDPLIAEDGTIAAYREGEYNLDQINPGRNLLTLFERTGERRFALAADYLKAQLERQPRTLSGVFWHKEIYPWQIWLDGVYMQGPFNAGYCHLFGKSEGFDDIVRQVITVYETLRDPETGLLYHAYDESRGQRWSDLHTGLSPHFWGRAMGWYCMAVLDILDILPHGYPKQGALLKIVRTLVDAILPWQQKDGMWYQVIDEPERKGNYPETSCSAMFCTLLYKVVRRTLVEDPGLRAECLSAARRCLDGMIDRYLFEDGDGHLHLGGICSVAGLGGNPYRNGSFDYYVGEAVVEDDFKGVGPFILAALEEERTRQGVF